MARRSAKGRGRRIVSSHRRKSRAQAPKSGSKRHRSIRIRPAAGARVRVVRSRSTGARRSKRPLPAAESLAERMFQSSLERSLRDYRALWEALAKR